jgi:hypothetical protein
MESVKYAIHDLIGCVCVCVFVCDSVCVCVCASFSNHSGRERERECVCVCVCVRFTFVSGSICNSIGGFLLTDTNSPYLSLSSLGVFVA